MQEIKEFRKKQGWTQKQIAEYLEIPTITYIQWENGTRNAPQYVLNLIKYKLRTDTKQISLELATGRTFNVTEYLTDPYLDNNRPGEFCKSCWYYESEQCLGNELAKQNCIAKIF